MLWRPMLFVLLVIPLLLISTLALAAHSPPPLIPEGEAWDSWEALVAGISRRSSVNSVAFSPDGSRLASGGDDGTVRVWDVGSGAEIRVLEGHGDSVSSVAFSPDGSRLASGGVGGKVRHWQAASGMPLGVLVGGQRGTWLGCMAGRCLRHDDGTLLRRIDGAGRVRPLPPPAPSRPGRLTVGWAKAPSGAVPITGESMGTSLHSFAHPAGGNVEPLLVRDGKRTPVTLRVRNRGAGRVYWVDVVQREPARTDPTRAQAKEVPKLELGNQWRSGRLGNQQNGQLTVGWAKAGSSRGGDVSIDSSVMGIPCGDFAHPAGGDSASLPAGGAVPGTRLVFHPPATRVILEPGEGIELTGHVSFHSEYKCPRGARETLYLAVTSAHGEPVPLAIPVRAQTPQLALREAAWQWADAWQWLRARFWPEDATREGGNALTILLDNLGGEALANTKFSLRVAGVDVELDTIERKTAPPGPLGKLDFALPAGFMPHDDTRITLEAFQLGPPAHRWRFDKEPITIPPPPWPLFAGLAALFLATLSVLYYLLLYRHPLVRQLSAEPAGLLRLVPSRLPQARRLLRRTRRLVDVLGKVGAQPPDLAAALAYPGLPAEERCRVLAVRLGVASEAVAAGLWRLRFGEGFPVNLTECLVHFPERGQSVKTVIADLSKNGEARERVVVILHGDEGEQEKLRRLADDPGNLYVAPPPAGVTELLLSPQPMTALARMVSDQIRLMRISPYQSGGGTARNSMFFGRGQLIAHIMNRAPANYLVVGGRQLGKSSLLKALEWRYRERPDVDCHYLSLGDEVLLPRLARQMDLPVDVDLDGFIAHLTQGTGEKRLLFLIDEADAFVAAEAGSGYGTLRRVRSLSEEGRAHFILAGYWELYRHVALDYQSPLKNFGEVLAVGALEPDACRRLATEPMARMGIDYEADGGLARLLAATGQRANLIAIACNEIVKRLGEEGRRRIASGDVDKALSGQGIRIALDGWEQAISDDPGEARLGRMVVYATVEGDGFDLGSLAERLAAAREEAEAKAGVEAKRSTTMTTRDLERALALLSLAYIIEEEDGRYRYRVPLFRERMRTRAPGRLLADEFSDGFSSP